ncbi:unnamed protein product, partial [Laminaria digitata]
MHDSECAPPTPEAHPRYTAIVSLGMDSRFGDRLLEIRVRYVFMYSAILEGIALEAGVLSSPPHTHLRHTRDTPLETLKQVPLHTPHPPKTHPRYTARTLA